MNELTILPIHTDTDLTVGARVKLKDKTEVLVTQHGTEAGQCGVVTVDMYQVMETETELDVLWQDGSIETILARDVVPLLNPDEYDCW
jgi:ubiquitin-conjugating enzyme E2 O